MFILNFLIMPYLVIAFGMSFDMGLIFALTVGNEPNAVGILRTERYGGQIIEEIEKDYPSITIGRRKSLFQKKSRRHK